MEVGRDRHFFPLTEDEAKRLAPLLFEDVEITFSRPHRAPAPTPVDDDIPL